MERFLQYFFDGLSAGSIYALPRPRPRHRLPRLRPPELRPGRDGDDQLRSSRGGWHDGGVPLWLGGRVVRRDRLLCRDGGSSASSSARSAPRARSPWSWRRSASSSASTRSRPFIWKVTIPEAFALAVPERRRRLLPHRRRRVALREHRRARSCSLVTVGSCSTSSSSGPSSASPCAPSPATRSRRRSSASRPARCWRSRGGWPRPSAPSAGRWWDRCGATSTRR